MDGSAETRTRERAPLTRHSIDSSLLPSTGNRRPLFVLLERFQNQLAQFILRRYINDRSKKRKAAPVAVDGVLPGGERDIAPRTSIARLPDSEADELEAFQRAVGKMQ